jgi:hypothetical protein
MGEGKDFEVKEKYEDFELVYKGPRRNYSIKAFYKGTLIYEENNAGSNNTIYSTIKDLSADEKWAYIEDVAKVFSKISHNVIFKNLDIEEKYLCAEIICSLITFIVNFLKEDYKKSRNHYADIPQKGAEVSGNMSLLKELERAGQIKQQNGKYRLLTKLRNFIEWCINENYISEKKGGVDHVTPKFIKEHIQTNCTLETIKRYFRDQKEPAEASKNKKN